MNLVNHDKFEIKSMKVLHHLEGLINQIFYYQFYKYFFTYIKMSVVEYRNICQQKIVASDGCECLAKWLSVCLRTKLFWV